MFSLSGKKKYRVNQKVSFQNQSEEALILLKNSLGLGTFN